MASQRPLARPPVKEALIDIRIASDKPIGADQLAPLRPLLSARYPNVLERRGYRAEFRVDDGVMMPVAPEDLGFAGLWFKSADGHRIAQCRPDGITLNQVAQFVSADEFIPEALDVWDLFKAVAENAIVTRVAMRYINVLLLPMTHGDDFDRFLVEPPRLPNDAPQLFSGFFSRIVAHQDPDAVIVTQRLEGAVEPGKPLPVVLDIDVVCEQGLSSDRKTLDFVLRRLRQLKNRVFFSLLTEEGVQLFA